MEAILLLLIMFPAYTHLGGSVGEWKRKWKLLYEFREKGNYCMSLGKMETIVMSLGKTETTVMSLGFI